MCYSVEKSNYVQLSEPSHTELRKVMKHVQEHSPAQIEL